MAEELYGALDAPIHGTAYAKEYGLFKGIVALWDVSLKPGGNDPVKKLGQGEGQAGAAICAFDTNTNAAGIADGLPGVKGNRSQVNTRRSFNPDNWVFRPHYAMQSNDRDATWDVRLVAEHENESDSRNNRGTIVVNQKDTQDWGWLNDIAWVRKMGSAISDEEIMFNGAGFLSALYGPNGGGGSSKRAAVATPVCRNGGFVTDGKYDGQWSQAGKFIIGPTALPKKPKDTPPPNGGVATGQPADGNGNNNGGISSASGEYSAGQNFGAGNTGQVSGSGTGSGDFSAGGSGPGAGQGNTAGPAANITGAGAGPLGDTTGTSAFGTSDTTQVATDQTVATPGGKDPGKGNPGQTQTDPKPPMGVEWGMRADCGIDFGSGIIGRFAHEPGSPTDGSGEPRLVRLFADKYGTPDDHLDTEEDSSSNHQKLPKKVLKKIIRGWVNVPKPSPSETHTDYSYHGDSHNGSSSSSSSSGSSASGTPTPGGKPVPPSSGTDPDDSDAESGGAGYDGVPGNDAGDASTTGGGSNTDSGGSGGGNGSPGGTPTGDTKTQTFTDKEGHVWSREVPINADGTLNGAAAGPYVKIS
jgi:hypothetical protein